MNGQNVHISWTAPADGASAISAYTVKILQQDGVTLTSNSYYCDGSSLVVMSNRFCEIPMSVLTFSPFSLSLGALIQATVFATNSLGKGTPSSLNTAGVLAQGAPFQPPSAPTKNPATTSASISVDYAMLTGASTGGSTILSLNLQWDAGTSGARWTTLIGQSPYSTTTSYTVSGGIIAGGSYKFRYRAYNVFGWGPYSSPVSIIAAQVPQQMDPVTVTLVGSSVKVSWSPLESNGRPITAYKVEIK